MAKAVFQNPIFQDETKAREALEAVLWELSPKVGDGLIF